MRMADLLVNILPTYLLTNMVKWVLFLANARFRVRFRCEPTDRNN